MQVFSKLAWHEGFGASSCPSCKAVLPQEPEAFRVQGAIKRNIARNPVQTFRETSFPHALGCTDSTSPPDSEPPASGSGCTCIKFDSNLQTISATCCLENWALDAVYNWCTTHSCFRLEAVFTLFPEQHVKQTM